MKKARNPPHTLRLSPETGSGHGPRSSCATPVKTARITRMWSSVSPTSSRISAAVRCGLCFSSYPGQDVCFFFLSLQCLLLSYFCLVPPF